MTRGGELEVTMIAKRNAWLNTLLVVFGVWVAWSCAVTAKEANLKLEVKLIWGTNDAASPDPKHKKIDSALTKWLGNKYKWRNYFEVNQKAVTIPVQGVAKVSLSPTCRVDVKYLGGSRIEVKLYGQEKLVNTVVHTLPQNDRLVIAGDDKNNTAWFIAFKLL